MGKIYATNEDGYGMSRSLRRKVLETIEEYEQKTNDAMALAKNPTPAGYMAQGRVMAYQNVVSTLLGWVGQ